MDRDDILAIVGVGFGVLIMFILTVYMMVTIREEVRDLEKAIKESKPQVYEYHYYEQPTKRGLK